MDFNVGAISNIIDIGHDEGTLFITEFMLLHRFIHLLRDVVIEIHPDAFRVDIFTGTLKFSPPVPVIPPIVETHI